MKREKNRRAVKKQQAQQAEQARIEAEQARVAAERGPVDDPAHRLTSLATSNFKTAYARTAPPDFPDQLLQAVRKITVGWCDVQQPPG